MAGPKHAEAPLRSPGGPLRIRVPGTAEGVRRVLSEIDGFISSNPDFEPLRADFAVVLDEVASNVVNYAYGGGSDRPIVVEARAEAGELQVEVIDEGPPFNPLERPAPATDQPLSQRPIGGLGIHIVKELMDEVDYRRVDDRNRLRFAKRLRPR
jgi:anti-sigma regulatory factor (Ser/Thr protein kinase)